MTVNRKGMDQQRATATLVVGGMVFIVLSGVLAEGTHIHRLLESGIADSAGAAVGVLTIAWWCLTAWLAATVLKLVSHRFFFPFDDQPRRRKILADLAAGLIYLGAFFGILQYPFHQPIAGLLATSGVIAVVLGLALQSTLADLFSGIALNIESPFRAGDWITVDGTSEGQVIEINWRATRIRDRSGDVIIIPNSQIAKSRVTNHCLPEKVHPSSINVDVRAESPADKVGRALVSATLGATHVLSDPAPLVTVQEIRGRTASYCVSFFVADFEDIPSAQCDALQRVLSCVASGELQLAGTTSDVCVLQDARESASAS